MPISPISLLLQTLHAQAASERSADAMAEMPDEAIAQMRDLLMQIRNVSHPFGGDPASGPAWEASRHLQHLVDQGAQGLPLSRECFARALIHVGHVQQDVRRQLGETVVRRDPVARLLPAKTTAMSQEELQRLLAQTSRLLGFPRSPPRG